MPKVFISYARDESHGQNLATECQQELQTAGFKVFRDVEGLKPGDVWYSKLEFELETSDVVVLVVSEKVRRSKWVHNEISMAEEIGLPVIPVFAEAIRSPLWLRHLQALDFALSTDWSVLIEAIHTKGTQSAEQSVANQAVTPAITQAAIITPEAPEIIVKPELVIATPTIKDPLIYQRDQYRESSPWASEVDIDEFGVYADLNVKGVIQCFRLIESGTFRMGSSGLEKERYDWEIPHQVTLSKPLWLADTACTQALWEVVMGGNPSHFDGDKNNPVENVSWNYIQTFIQVLNTMRSDLALKLPTEAQWEYACRAGSITEFSFGHNIMTEQVNYRSSIPYAGGKVGLDREKTVPVKSLEANTWGLYEMHGNVREWCQDWFGDYMTENITDPEGPKTGKSRVLRGGSWISYGGHCRAAARRPRDPLYSSYDFGFRLSQPCSE